MLNELVEHRTTVREVIRYFVYIRSDPIWYSCLFGYLCVVPDMEIKYPDVFF